MLPHFQRLLRPAPLSVALLLALFALLAAGGLVWAQGWLDGTRLARHQQQLLAAYASGPLWFALALFVGFTALSALALPGCSVLALAAGATLGWGPGTALVALASTAGATLSFLAARHLWRDAAQRRFGHRLGGLQEGLARDGALYLFALRLVPIIPFPLLNPLMGLSAMPVGQFALTSLLGMLLGSAAFVYAGTALAPLPTGAAGGFDVMPLLWGLSAALLLPVVAKLWWSRRQRAA